MTLCVVISEAFSSHTDQLASRNGVWWKHHDQSRYGWPKKKRSQPPNQSAASLSPVEESFASRIANLLQQQVLGNLRSPAIVRPSPVTNDPGYPFSNQPAPLTIAPKTQSQPSTIPQIAMSCVPPRPSRSRRLRSMIDRSTSVATRLRIPGATKRTVAVFHISQLPAFCSRRS